MKYYIYASQNGTATSIYYDWLSISYMPPPKDKPQQNVKKGKLMQNVATRKEPKKGQHYFLLFFFCLVVVATSW